MNLTKLPNFLSVYTSLLLTVFLLCPKINRLTFMVANKGIICTKIGCRFDEKCSDPIKLDFLGLTFGGRYKTSNATAPFFFRHSPCLLAAHKWA